MNFHGVERRYLSLFVANHYLRHVSMDAVFFHITSSNLGCAENTARNIKQTVFWCLQRQGISTLPHENLLSIMEIMSNFLTRSVRIQVQNNRNMSHDSPP